MNFRFISRLFDIFQGMTLIIEIDTTIEDMIPTIATLNRIGTIDTIKDGITTTETGVMETEIEGMVKETVMEIEIGTAIEE